MGRLGRNWLGLAGVVACASLPLIADDARAATIPVDTTADTVAADGFCSIREAITAANTNATVDECVHDGGSGLDSIELPAGTITLGGASGDDGNLSGDLDIEPGTGGGVVISGAGIDDTIVDADDNDRVFHIFGSVGGSTSVTFEQMTIRDGNAPIGEDGGGVLLVVAVNLNLDQVRIDSSEGAPTTDGGGLNVEGTSPTKTTTITDSRFTGNATGSRGGAIHVQTGSLVVTGTEIDSNTTTAAFGFGGGISHFGPASLTDVEITNNVSGRDGGGIGGSTDLTIEDSLLSGNEAGEDGGAVYNTDDLTVTNTLIHDNEAAERGGGILRLSSTREASITDSALTMNRVTTTGPMTSGGGLYLSGIVSLTDTIVRDNLADNNNPVGGEAAGGGIVHVYPGRLKLERTEVSGNRAEAINALDAQVGGIDAYALQALNTTISANTVSAGGRTGALRTGSGATNLVNVTISGNVAPAYDAISPGSGPVTLRSTIIDEGNDPGACESPVISDGFNVDATSSCFAAGPDDLTATDPLLGALADNGGVDAAGQGPPLTHLPALASPVVDKVPVVDCTDDDLIDPAGTDPVSVDGRGLARPVNGGCETGAVELPVCGGQLATIFGTNDAETITGTAGADVIVGLGGDDEIDGLGGDDLICSGGGNDIATGGAGQDVLLGEAGNDSLAGDGDVDVISGGAGNDQADGGGGDDTLLGGGGDDSLGGASGNDLVNGDTGSDQLEGAAGQDALDGGEGNDLLEGGADDDTLDGGDGDDSLDGGDGDDSLNGGDGNDILIGNEGGDVLTGDQGNDSLDGGAGADALSGDDGDDSLDGGGGADTLAAGAGADTAKGGGGNDKLTLGGGADSGKGGGGRDIIKGNGGGDELRGQGGSRDKLVGGGGRDGLGGGPGKKDRCIGNSGRDRDRGGCEVSRSIP